MTLEKYVSKIFNLTDENWMKHANPRSVWSRYSVLPIIIIVFWSRKWLGIWCLVPVLFSLCWMMINPVLFSQPRSTKNWASKAVLGERVYINRDVIPIPEHYNMVKILNIISFLGLVLSIYGIIKLEVWPTVFGVSVVYLAKSWFLDRMVWLYEDMSHLPEYSKWLY